MPRKNSKIYVIKCPVCNSEIVINVYIPKVNDKDIFESFTPCENCNCMIRATYRYYRPHVNEISYTTSFNDRLLNNKNKDDLEKKMLYHCIKLDDIVINKML